MDNRIFFKEIFLTAVLFTLAQPPFSLYGVPFIFLFPVLWLIYRNNDLKNISYKYVFFNGWFLGFFISILTLFWIYKVTLIGVLPLFIIEAVFYGGIFVLFKFFSLKNRIYNIFLFVLLWNIMDFFRSKTIFAFPWNPIGEMVYYFISFIQIADLGGIWLVGIMLSIFNALLFIIIFQRNRKSNIIFFILLSLIIVIYGEWRLKSIKLKKSNFKVALIQGNIDQGLKWNSKLYLKNLNKYIQMSEIAARRGAKLILWPETAATCYLKYNFIFFKEISEFTKRNKVTLITGSLGYKNKKNYNSAFGIDTLGKIFYSYDKIKLVPFGERIPFSDKYPILNKIDFGQGDFWYGKNYNMAVFDGLRFPTFICYEIIFPDFVRKFVNLGANFLVNLTNDAWFGKYSAPQQHAYLVPFRAIENRIGIVRVANTGISFFINPFGIIYKSSGIFEDNILIDNVFIKVCNTVYEKFGDSYIYFIFILIILGKIIDVLYGRR